MLEKLRQAGAKCDNAPVSVQQKKDNLLKGEAAEERPEESFSTIYQMAEIGHLHGLLECIKQRADVNSRSPDGRTPLQIACWYGKHDLIEELLLQNADPFARTEEEFFTTVADFVRFGCGKTSEHYLSMLGEYESLDQQWKKVIKEKRTYLEEHLPVVLGIVPSPGTFASKRTLLHIACACGDLAAVRRRIKLRDDVNARDQFSAAPLHLASFFGHKDVVSLLLAHKADVFAMTVSAKVALQIQRGANVDAKEQQEHGFLPHHLAKSCGHVGVVAELLKGCGIVGAPVQ